MAKSPPGGPTRATTGTKPAPKGGKRTIPTMTVNGGPGLKTGTRRTSGAPAMRGRQSGCA